MRDGFRLFASSVAVIALALGLALKADRYGPAKAPNFKIFETIIETRLRTDGWQQVTASPSVTDAAFKTLTFRHTTCPQKLKILILGHTPDLVPLLRTRFSNGLALIQDGQRVEAFDSRALQFANLWNALGRSLLLTAATTPPLIAQTPPPSAIAQTCPQTPLPKAAELLKPPITL